MPNEEFKTIVLEEKLREILDQLIQLSASFSAEPLPYGHWEITTKYEEPRVMLLKKYTVRYIEHRGER
jgi:hypothetical protein